MNPAPLKWISRTVATYTAPAKRIACPVDRHQAALLTSFLVVMLLFTSIIVVQSLAETGFSLETVGIAVTWVLLVGLLWLSRTNYHNLATYLVLLLTSISILISSIPDGDLSRINLLMYLLVPLLLSSALQPLRVTALIATLNWLAAGILLIVATDLAFGAVVDWMVFLGLIFAMVLVVALHRNGSEKIRQAALAESERRLRLITDNVNDIISLADHDGIPIYTSPSQTTVLGYPVEPNLHANTWLERMHPDDAQALLDQYRRLTPDNSTIIFEHRMRHQKGHYVWLETRSTLLYDENQNFMGIVSASRDMTARKQLEEQTLKLAVEQEKVRFLEAFINNLSHDLRTPLSIMDTSLFLLEKTHDPDKLQRRMETMRAQTAHMRQLIEKVLTMGRLDSQHEFDLTFIHLNDVLHPLMKRYEVIAEMRKIHLSLDTANSLPKLLADEEQLSRALSNLLDNALRYTAEGGAISIEVTRDADALKIAVSDTGQGIPARHLPKIFERFYRVDATRSEETGGTGLGLAIVHKIVTMHQGTIEVSSVVGEGTTFTIRLPLVPTHQHTQNR